MNERSIKFLVVIPTFRRHNLLKETIQSVINQTYKNWKIIVSDSGLTLDDTTLSGWFPTQNDKISLIQYSTELGANVHWERLLSHIDRAEGEYFVLLGDDDTLSERCLETVASNAGPGVIACGVCNFFESNANYVYSIPKAPEYWDLDFESFIISNVENHGCGICRDENPLKICVRSRQMETHVSGYFISKTILKLVMARYKSLWVRPFADVGIALAIFTAGFVRMISKPLVIVRRHSLSGGMAFVSSDRLLLARGHSFEFKKQAPSIVCFNVFATLSYMEVFEKLNNGWRVSVRAWFYVICLKQITLGGAGLVNNTRDIFKLLRHAFRTREFWKTLFPEIIYHSWTRKRRSELMNRGQVILKANSMTEVLLAIAK